MERLQGQLLYFAYGADLCREAFERRRWGAEWLGVAKMEGHRFMIGALGRATVEAKEGVAVWGGLWLVPANELSAMDGLAGVADGHSERTTRRVVSSGGPCIEAMVYIASPGGLPGKNAAAAVAEVIAGARESHLPAAYIKELQTWENAGA